MCSVQTIAWDGNSWFCLTKPEDSLLFWLHLVLWKHQCELHSVSVLNLCMLEFPYAMAWFSIMQWHFWVWSLLVSDDCQCLRKMLWFSPVQVNCVFCFVQVDLMKNISNIPQPFLYTRHVHFLNFTRYSMDTMITAFTVTLNVWWTKFAVCCRWS